MIAALLLAAGSARRFGAPKLLEELDGRPLIRWSADALLASRADRVFVVVPPDHARFRGALADTDAELRVNPNADSGIGSSFGSGISRGNTQIRLTSWL